MTKESDQVDRATDEAEVDGDDNERTRPASPGAIAAIREQAERLQGDQQANAEFDAAALHDVTAPLSETGRLATEASIAKAASSSPSPDDTLPVSRIEDLDHVESDGVEPGGDGGPAGSMIIADPTASPLPVSPLPKREPLPVARRTERVKTWTLETGGQSPSSEASAAPVPEAAPSPPATAEMAATQATPPAASPVARRAGPAPVSLIEGKAAPASRLFWDPAEMSSGQAVKSSNIGGRASRFPLWFWAGLVVLVVLVAMAILLAVASSGGAS